MGKSALVVGVGGFGKWHAYCLGQMPEISKLYVTRSSFEGLQNSIDDIRNVANKDRSVHNLVTVDGTVVSSANQLGNIFDLGLKFDLVSIASPDATHIPYAHAAKPHAKHVIIEKPPAPADGEGASLVVLDQILGPEDANPHVSMELPMVGIGRSLFNGSIHDETIRNANRITMYWSVKTSDKPIVQNLAPHPWSLFKDNYDITIESSELSVKQAHIHGHLTSRTNNRSIPFTMALAYKMNDFFRGFGVECEQETDCTFQVKEVDPKRKINHILRHDISLSNGIPSGFGPGTVAAESINPLKSCLQAALDEKPWAPYKDICNLQLFLEQAYKVNKNA